MEIYWGNVWDGDFDLEKGGKSNPKLIPMKKTVYKDGKPYSQTFWVLPDEIQGNDKQVHSDLKEHLRHVRKTLGADKYKSMLSDNGVKWNPHASDKIDTMNATSAAIQHLKNGGTLTHKGEGDEEHVITGKHQTEHANDQHAEENKSKPYHIFNQKTGQFEPVNGVPVAVGGDIDAFLYQLKDGKFVVSEGNSGFSIASNSGNGYDTKEEAIGAAKKTVSDMGEDKLKASIKQVINSHGISPSHSHNYNNFKDDEKEEPKPKPEAKPTVSAKKPEPKPESKKEPEKEEKKPESELYKTLVTKGVSEEKAKAIAELADKGDKDGAEKLIDKLTYKDTENSKMDTDSLKLLAKYYLDPAAYNYHKPTKANGVKPTVAAKKPEPEKEKEVASVTDMNGEKVKVGDTVKDTNGKNFVVTKIEANGTVWGKRIGKGKENAKPKVIKNDFKKFAPKGGTPVVPSKKTEPKKLEAKPTVPAGKKADDNKKPKSDVNEKELTSLKSELKKIDGLPDKLIDDLVQAVSDKGFGMHTKTISQKLKDEGKITQGQLYNIGDAFVSAIKEHSKILEQKAQDEMYKLEKEKFGDNVITPTEKTQLKNYFSEWYGSSTNSHSTAMRSMLERLGLVAKGCFMATLNYMGGHNNKESIQKKAALHTNATMMSALKKLQKYTHEELKSKGGSGTVVLYRRISDYDLKQQLQSSKKGVYKHNPIDSWSTRDDLTGFGSIVMKYEVPIEHILSNHQNMLTKAGWSNGEQEWFPLPQHTDLNLELGKNCWIGDVPHSEIKKNVQNNLPYLSKSSSHYYSQYLDGSWDSELKKQKELHANKNANSKTTAWKPPSSSNKAVTKAQQHAKKIIKEVMKKHGEYNFDAHAAENLEGIDEGKFHDAIDDIKKNPDFLKYLKKKGAVASNWEPEEDDEHDNHKLEEHADDLLHQEIDNWQGNEHTLKKSEILITVPLGKRN